MVLFIAAKTQSYSMQSLLLWYGLIHRSKDSKFIIFSDSLSILQALVGFRLELDLEQKIIKDYTQLVNSGKAMVL